MPNPPPPWKSQIPAHFIEVDQARPIVPPGSYSGRCGGTEARMDYRGVTLKLLMDRGVRGLNMPCTIRVLDIPQDHPRRVTVEPHPEQFAGEPENLEGVTELLSEHPENPDDPTEVIPD